MRTTLTLDDDVADFLKEQSQSLGLPFKQVVNNCIRSAMTAAQEGDQRPKRFKVTPHQSDFLPGIDVLKLNQLADDLEAEDFTSEAAS